MPAPTRVSKTRMMPPGTSPTLSLAATGITPMTPVRGRRLSVYANWSGTPTGTFVLMGSDGIAAMRPIPGAAAEFTANGNAQPAGTASSAVWNWDCVPGTEVAIAYTASGGTGSLTYTYVWGD